MPHDEIKNLLLYVIVLWLVASSIVTVHIQLSGADAALSFDLGLIGGLFGPALGFVLYHQHQQQKHN